MDDKVRHAFYKVRMATRFTLRHRINTSEELFWTKIFGNQDFDKKMYVDEFQFGYEMLEQDESTGFRKSKVQPNMDAPAAVKKVLGDGLSFVESGTYREGSKRYRFDVEPSKLAEKIRIQGDMRTESDGDDACFRVVEFSIDVKIFGVGKIIEGFVENNTRDSYDRSAAFTNKYIVETF